MALLYQTLNIQNESNDVVIRRLEDDEDYEIAITFPQEEDDDEVEVTEILLTRGEVQEAYDLLFNRR